MIAEISTVLAAIVKGIDYAERAIAVGKDATPVLTAIKDLGEAAFNGPVTVEQVNDTHTVLDREIEDFNAPI